MSLISDVIAKKGGKPLSGLEQLQAMIEYGERPGIAETLDFDLAEVGAGTAVFAGTPGVFAHNPMGIVHGGYIATLLDSACGCAMHTTLEPGQGYTTLEIKIAFHEALTENTELVRAEGRVLTRGRRVGYSEARIVDKEGRLYASATSTLLVIEP
jgi:uncharacterized protein (TIGR00369 family)